MSKGQLILDNSVLSAFAAGEWFHDVSFWASRYTLYTTEQIWAHEFRPHHAFSKTRVATSGNSRYLQTRGKDG